MPQNDNCRLNYFLIHKHIKLAIECMSFFFDSDENIKKAKDDLIEEYERLSIPDDDKNTKIKYP